MRHNQLLLLMIIVSVLTSIVDLDLSYARGGRGGGSVSVKGYTRKDGTYVQPHYRSAPDGNFNNNWSTKGNVNPYTGKEGTKIAPSNSTPQLYDRPSNAGSDHSDSITDNSQPSTEHRMKNTGSEPQNHKQQIYTWEDDQGGRHSSTNRSEVPQHVLEKIEPSTDQPTGNMPAR